MNPELEKKLQETHERIIAYNMQEAPIEALGELIDLDLMSFVTTSDEVIQGLDAYIDLLKKQWLQMSDESLSMEVERKEIFRRYSPSHETAIIAEIVTANISSDTEVYTLDLRLSRLFELINGKWKLVHSHSSTPSSTENDTLHLNEWKAEKEQLERLVSEQTADLKNKNEELKIEAALERVRSSAMAMQHGEELATVISVVFQQLVSLGFESEACGLNLYDEHEGMTMWISGFGEDIYPESFHINFFDHPYYLNQLKSWKNAEKYGVLIFEGELKRQYDEQTFSNPDFFDLHDEIKDAFLSKEKVISCAAYMKYGMLEIIGNEAISERQSDILCRFAKVFQQAYTRFLDLKKVEEQAREANIEAALAHVRAVSLQMTTPADMLNICRTISDQLQKLGINHIRNIQTVIIEEEKNTYQNYQYFTAYDKQLIEKSDFDINASVHTMIQSILKSPDAFFTGTATGEELEAFKRFRKEEDDFAEDLLYEAEAIEYHFFSIGSGALGITLYSTLNEEGLGFFRRFHSVFSLSYQRFKDIEKSEAQAREAIIEAGLERVRSKTMAMHHSSELESVIKQIFQEIEKLDIEALAADLIFFNDSPSNFTLWISGTNGTEGPFHLSNINHPHQNAAYQTWKNGESLRLATLKGDEFKSYFETLFNPVNGLHTIKPETRDLVFKLGSINHAESFTKHGCIRVASTEILNDDQCAILSRFASAFDLAYRRFLDLQKAEKQAKETKIELSLERIRSGVTAMQKSSELFDIVVTMRNEFISLGHRADYFWHMKWAAENYEMSMTAEDGSRLGMVISIPKFVHEQIESLYQWEESDEPYFVLALNGPEAWDYIDNMNTYGKYQQVDPHAPTEEDIHHIGGLTFIIVRTTHGEIGYSLPGYVPHPPIEGIEILIRFAGAFDLAYRRFEDLMVAEQQAYEARVETSLERIRGLASAMNHSDDLKQIAEAMFSEMEVLQINPLRYGLAMIQESSMQAELWASTVADGKFLDLLGTVSFDWHPMLKEGFDAWEKQYEEHIYTLKGEEIRTYYERISQINPNIKNLDALLTPDSELVQYCSFFPFKTGILYAFTEVEPDEEGLTTLKRFANVFEQAHIRYIDLQIAEEQAQLIIEERDRLEQTLKELRSTQEQLIQQEKLASLGQLTAGIAHEIKNPLNFVNNFSDLSIELVDETREELQKDPADTEEALEILNDIEANLKTIHKHGSRADSIVKSMLQHSRGGSGSMEAVALNPLIQEFVNLAFHGMRAGKDPINVDIELKLDDTITDIQLIAEDFSRVILNICNNAFDAMREKATKVEKQQIETSYHPKLSIRTRSEDGKVHIEIEDNGPGIPEAMKDKITQPFFTTKKGTDGTGLGLSITHDIIKAHGGTLEVHSTEMVHTIFKITL